MQIVRLIQTRPQQYKLDGKEKLRFLGDFTDNETRVQAVRDLLDTLATPRAA
jgi:transcription-repair coupling factor (superfamily II helicase)